jgi:hypothetical protein
MRILEEFRKNPCIKIPSKSPFRNSQSLAKLWNLFKFKNQNAFDFFPMEFAHHAAPAHSFLYCSLPSLTQQAHVLRQFPTWFPPPL